MPRPTLTLRRTLTCLGCLLAVGAATTWATPPAANRSVRIGDRDGDRPSPARPADDLILPAAAAAPAEPESVSPPVVPVDAAATITPSAAAEVIAVPRTDLGPGPDAAPDADPDTPAAADGPAAIAPASPVELTASERADLAAVRQRRADFGGRRLGSGAADASPRRDVRDDAPTVADASPTAATDRPFSFPGLSGGGGGGGGWELVRVGLALGVVLALAIGLQRLLRRVGRRGPGRPSGVLEVMARYPVGRGQQLSIIRLGRRLLLVHQHAGDMRTITEVTDPDEVASLMTSLEPGGAGSDFDAMVRDFQTGDGRGLPGPPAGTSETVAARPARTPRRPAAHPAAREVTAGADPGVGRLLDRTVGLDDDPIVPAAMAADTGTPVSPSRLQSALGALRAARRVETGVQSEVEVVDLTTRSRRPRRTGRPGAAA